MVAELEPIRRGRPPKGESIRLGIRIQRDQEREAWNRVRLMGNVIHLAVVAERPDIADHSAGELVVLASRRLRQLGEEDAR